MDVQTAFNVLLGVGLAALGWFANELWNAVKDLRTDLADLREEIPKNYASRADFKDGMAELKDLLERIDAKLDRKADK